MFKEMGEDLDKKLVEYKQQIEDYKTKLDFDGLVEKYKQEPFDFDKWLKDKGKMFMPPKTSVKVVNKSTNPNPEFATDGASGFDLRANLAEDETITLGIGEYTMVPTGLYFEIPEGFELQVRPRSGLAAKHGVTVLNSPGTVDCVPKGTKISTPNGDINVEDIFNKKGKQIINSFDVNLNEITEDLVTDIWVFDDVELLEIITDEGDAIRVPKTKEILTENGWVMAINLSVSDKILKI